MSKSYAEMIYKSNPQYVQAKSQYEMADCDGDFSKYMDPKWQQAKRQYQYYKDFGIAQDWSPQYMKAKASLEKLERDLEDKKRQSQPCAGYY